MNKSATVRNDTEATVYLKLTVPFGCPNGTDKCYIVAMVLLPKNHLSCKAAEVTQRTDEFEQKPCGILFYNDE